MEMDIMLVLYSGIFISKSNIDATVDISETTPGR